jgi:hypothetical protein
MELETNSLDWNGNELEHELEDMKRTYNWAYGSFRIHATTFKQIHVEMCLMPYPCSHFYVEIKFGDRLYSKEQLLGPIF